MLALLSEKVEVKQEDDFVLNLPKTGNMSLDSHYEAQAAYKWGSRFFDAPSSDIQRIELENGYYFGETRDG